MKYTVTGVKTTPIAKKDGMGTWNKIQVKTKETGEQILDLGFSVSKSVRDSVSVGSVITGYVEQKQWSSNGKTGVNLTLEGITAEYVYNLLLKLNPNIEGGSSVNTLVPATPIATGTGSFGADAFTLETIQYPIDDINPDDIPF